MSGVEGTFPIPTRADYPGGGSWEATGVLDLESWSEIGLHQVRCDNEVMVITGVHSIELLLWWLFTFICSQRYEPAVRCFWLLRHNWTAHLSNMKFENCRLNLVNFQVDFKAKKYPWTRLLLARLIGQLTWLIGDENFCTLGCCSRANGFCPDCCCCCWLVKLRARKWERQSVTD